MKSEPSVSQPLPEAAPEAKASPLCKCGHAKHKGRCGVRVIDLGYDCLCVEYRPSVSGKTAAPAPLACGHHDPASYFLGSKYANICGLPVGHDGRHACLDATWADGPSDYACSAINIQHEYIACELPNGHTGQHHHYGFRDWDASPTERRKAATITVAAAPATPTTAHFVQTCSCGSPPCPMHDPAPLSKITTTSYVDAESQNKLGPSFDNFTGKQVGASPSVEEDSEPRFSGRRCNDCGGDIELEGSFTHCRKCVVQRDTEHAGHPAGEGAPADVAEDGELPTDAQMGEFAKRPILDVSLDNLDHAESTDRWAMCWIRRLASSLRSARDDHAQTRKNYAQSLTMANELITEQQERLRAALSRVEELEREVAAYEERDRKAIEEGANVGIHKIEVVDGKVEMKFELAKEMMLLLAGSALKLLDTHEAKNYLEMSMGVPQLPGEVVTLVLQRHGPGILTPHQARQKAEAENERLRGAFLKLREEVRPLILAAHQYVTAIRYAWAPQDKRARDASAAMVKLEAVLSLLDRATTGEPNG